MNGDTQSRTPGFGPPVRNLTPQTPPPPWNPHVPPPNFSVPPPNMSCQGNFPRFSGPMHNQTTFNPPMGRGGGNNNGIPPPLRMNMPPPSFSNANRGGGGGNGNPRMQFSPTTRPSAPRFDTKSRNGVPPHSNPPRPVGFVKDDIFNDSPTDVPCGFPYFNPLQPPPLPNGANLPPPIHGNRGGRGGGFRGDKNGFSNNNNNNNNISRGRGGFRGGMNRGNFLNGRGGGNNHRGQDGFQKNKKPKVDKRDLPENNAYYCDICDRGFKTEEKYLEHVAGHEKCSYKDCPFVAAPKLVQLHMTMQHRGGLAKKIWSVETEEDIKKWKEERRKNFPTAENIKKKKERREERMARGEVIETKDFSKMTKGRQRGRGRDRGRGRGRGRFRRGRRYDDEDGDEHSAIDVDDDGPPEEVKIQRSRGQDKEDSIDLTKGADSDDQENKKTNPESNATSSPVKETNNVNNSLSLLSGYGSSSSSDSDDSSDDDNDDEEDKDAVKRGVVKVNKKTEPIIISDDSDNGNKFGLVSKSTCNTVPLSSLPPPPSHLTLPSTSLTPSPISPNKNLKRSSPSSSAAIIMDETLASSSSSSNKRVVSVCQDVQSGQSSTEQAADDASTRTGSLGFVTDKTTADSHKCTVSSIDKIHSNEKEEKTKTSYNKSDKQAGELVNGDISVKSIASVEEEKSGRSEVKGVKRGHVTKEGPPDKKAKVTHRQPQKSYTLLEKLLAREVRRERNKILQCVHYLVKNKFFGNNMNH